uniref:Uncharacterized protein n=1 Tax=Anopheles christyi TaxID=43041 RepID=A0A182K4M3_9DIPT
MGWGVHFWLRSACASAHHRV